jgi:transposase
MTRLYARSAGGGRISETTPGGRWKIMAILDAMSLGGIIASMTIEEATDGDIFLAYVEHILCPALKPGDVVVMDNLSSHKIKGVRRLIEKAGAEVLYLPPYSPDLTPSRKLGPSSNKSFARPRQGPKKRWKKPSPKPSG